MKDSETRLINGQTFAVVYDMGVIPLWYEVELDRYGRDVWERCDWSVVQEAIDIEQHEMMAELDDQREDERPTLWY